MPVNFTKKGFEKETKIWRQSIDELREKFDPLLKEAKKTKRERHSNPWTEGELKDNVEMMNRIGEKVSPKVFDADTPTSFLLPSLLESIEAEDEYEGDKPEIKEISKRSPIKIGNIEILWRHRFASLGDEGPLVDYAIEKENEILVVTNQDSPFSQLIENDSVLAVLNVADCITRFLIEELKYDYIKAITFRDMWLINVGSVLREKI